MGGRHQGRGPQRFAQLWKVAAVALNPGGLALDLIGTPAQVVHQQGFQLREAASSGVAVSFRVGIGGITCAGEALNGFAVALLSLDQLAAAAGHHPAGIHHRRWRHHQAHRLQIPQPLLVGSQFGVDGGGAAHDRERS
jgi:hypothetical protein